MRVITGGLLLLMLWAAITRPTPEIRYDYHGRATITQQEGAAP